MATDPICNMQVDERTAKWTTDYQGKRYYFCAPGCKAAFEKDPERYLGKTGHGGHHDGHHGCCGDH